MRKNRIVEKSNLFHHYEKMTEVRWVDESQKMKSLKTLRDKKIAIVGQIYSKMIAKPFFKV